MNGRYTDLREVYLFHLEKAYKQFKKYKADYFKRHGINMSSDQWTLLKGIHESEGTNQRALAKKYFKEPASVSRMLNKMEQKKWIRRKSLPNDRRTYELYLTKKGKELVEQLSPLAIEIRAKGTEGMFDQEVSKLNELLIRVFENYQ